MDTKKNAFAHDVAKDDGLVLVDLFDQQVGTATKERAHRAGLLHRAFSVMLWREGSQGVEILLSRRAEGKYHSGGLWANSCCSHPRSGEDLLDAVRRRLAEELDVVVDEAQEVGSFVYRAAFDNGITEYEFDHVFVAPCTQEPVPEPTEASEVRWVPMRQAMQEIMDKPTRFCAWVPNVLSLALMELKR